MYLLMTSVQEYADRRPAFGRILPCMEPDAANGNRLPSPTRVRGSETPTRLSLSVCSLATLSVFSLSSFVLSQEHKGVIA